MTDEIKDAVSGETLTAFTAHAADGRSIVVNARDSDTALRLAREQAGGIGILSLDEGAEEGESEQTDEYSGLDDDSVFTPKDDVPNTPTPAAVNPDVDKQPSTAFPNVNDSAAPPAVEDDSQAPQTDATYGTDAAPDGTISGERDDVSTGNAE